MKNERMYEAFREQLRKEVKRKEEVGEASKNLANHWYALIERSKTLERLFQIARDLGFPFRDAVKHLFGALGEPIGSALRQKGWKHCKITLEDLQYRFEHDIKRIIKDLRDDGQEIDKAYLRLANTMHHFKSKDDMFFALAKAFHMSEDEVEGWAFSLFYEEEE